MFAQQSLQGLDFGGVPFRRGRAVRIDVAHVIHIRLGLLQNQVQGSQLPLAVRCRHVAVVTGAGVANQFCIDRGAALLGVFPLFQHQSGRPFTQHQPTPLGMEGATRRFDRLLTRHRQHLQRFPGFHRAIGHGRLGTAGQGHRAVTHLHAPHGLAHRHRR